MKALVPADKISLWVIKDWDWETYVSYGQMVRSLKDGSQWCLGDLARGLEKKYGEDSLGKFARDIGENPKSLAEYRRVAKAYPSKKDRLPFLSFSHHQRALKASKPHKILKLAHDNEWSIKQLDRYLIAEKSVDCKHNWKNFKICSKCGKKLPLDNGGEKGIK